MTRRMCLGLALFGVALAACTDESATGLPREGFGSRASRPRFVKMAFGTGLNISDPSFAERFGIMANGLQHTGDQYMVPLMTQAGITWARVDFDWPALAYVQHQWNFDSTDITVARLDAGGIKILGTLAYTPPYGRADMSDTVDIAHQVPNAEWWEYYVRTVVSRYPQVDAWSIWNEATCTALFKGTGADYDVLVARALPIIRDAGKTLVIGEMPISQFGAPPNPDSCLQAAAARTWMQERLAAPAVEAAEAEGYRVVVSVHKYDKYASNVVATMQEWADPSVVDWRDVWLTEVGYSDPLDLTEEKQELNARMLHGVYYGMVQGSAPLWQKTFFTHLHVHGPTAEGILHQGILHNKYPSGGSGVDTLRAYHLLKRLRMGCPLSEVYLGRVFCVPIHELERWGDHAYVRDEQLGDTAGGYWLSKFAKFYLLPSARAGWHPLYLCRNANDPTDAPLVTDSEMCEGVLDEDGGPAAYTMVRILGWASDTPREGMVHISAWHSRSIAGTAGDIYVTTRYMPFPWLLIRNLGYVWPRGGGEVEGDW
ncbi:MAG TPA: hypothetical protein VF092_11255 [Longimicrobium sp.]